jgi:hypothetical protein
MITLLQRTALALGTVKEVSIEQFNLHSIFTMKQELQVNEPVMYVPATTVQKKKDSGEGVTDSSTTRGCTRTRGHCVNNTLEKFSSTFGQSLEGPAAVAMSALPLRRPQRSFHSSSNPSSRALSETKPRAYFAAVSMEVPTLIQSRTIAVS